MTRSTTFPPGHSNFGSRPVPPLEPGDRLSRAEFERRYAAMPDLKKAELIEGVVYMPAAVRARNHGRPQSHLLTWLGCYEASTPHMFVADNASVRLDLDNMPQPDALLLIEPGFGGQATISDDDYVEKAPELVAEIASSSVSFDLNTKMQVYLRNGVKEYLVWRVLDRQFDWFVFRDGEFHKQAPDPEGILKSTVFPGLWLDAAALLEGKLSQVLAVLDRGIKSPEHAAFVAKLQGK
ncbi:MAG TPA: Uma2 family endonuclease [Pirellulaceae bacterium]|nr:Uma2 family endonuclease [Pirellulaceae bacterium]